MRVRILTHLLLALCLALPFPVQAPAQTPDPPPTPPTSPQTPPADTTPQVEGTVPEEQELPPSTQDQVPTTQDQPPATTQPPAATQAPSDPSTAVPPNPSPAIPVPAPAPVADVIEFNLKFPEDEGGGSASGSAANLEYQRDNYAVLTGDVKIKYQDVDVQADRAELDLLTKIVTAEGNVIVDQGPRRMAGDTLEYDLDTKTGTLTNATAHVSPDYYFSGTELAKISENEYTVKNGIFTSCNQETPDWSFRLSEARVEVDGYAHVRNASMRAKKLPIFYTPYILWPVKSDRSSGLLIPNIGYSDRRGASVGLAYFQTLGRSYDTTFHLDLYTEQFMGVGNELRYAPTEGTKGEMLAYAIRDPEDIVDESWRWKVEWNHETTDLPAGMRGVVNFMDFSDFNFFRDFERDFDRNTLRFIDSRAFVTGNWGPHLLNILANSRETFVGAGVDDIRVEQRKLPEVEYRLRSTRLFGMPLYAQFQGSASFLDTVRPTSYSGSYGRVDAFPQLTLPIRSVPWLNLSVTGGERITWYGDSLNAAGNEFDGEALTRMIPFGNAQIVGPSFSRIFEGGFGFDRLKHVIEPRWAYTYLGEIDDLQEVPLFDEVDALRSTNQGRVSLTNRILAKPEADGDAREVFLFELARRFSFDDTQPLQTSQNGLIQSTEGPIEALARLNPTAGTSIKFEASYDTLFSDIASTELSGEVALGKGNLLGVTWFTRFQPELQTTVRNQLRVGGSLGLLKNLRVEGEVNYDLEQQLLQLQRYIFHFTQQCYGLRLEWRDFRAGVGARTRDKDFRFSLTLKNVGTFLDLTSRSSSAVEP
ncbi:MAG TPA: LPS assembly protein LptD [Thermoanaerobaculia bacterium]|nr:LPS assembly protein LptD [Thermoanaerobaculia bacterium]